MNSKSVNRFVNKGKDTMERNVEGGLLQDIIFSGDMNRERVGKEAKYGTFFE